MARAPLTTVISTNSLNCLKLEQKSLALHVLSAGRVILRYEIWMRIKFLLRFLNHWLIHKSQAIENSFPSHHYVNFPKTLTNPVPQKDCLLLRLPSPLAQLASLLLSTRVFIAPPFIHYLPLSGLGGLWRSLQAAITRKGLHCCAPSPLLT
jgi:hypothetical protein